MKVPGKHHPCLVLGPDRASMRNVGFSRQVGAAPVDNQESTIGKRMKCAACKSRT